MEQFEIVARRLHRLEHAHQFAQAALVEFAHEGRVAIGAERVAIGEAVAREALAGHQCDF